MNPKTSDKSKRSPGFRIHHLCMLDFNSCLFRSRKSKKKDTICISKKTLNWKFQNFVPQDPTKRQHTDTRDTSIVTRVLQASYIIHWACMQEKPAPVKEKIFKKIDFNLKKIVRELTFFFLKTLRKTPPNCNIMYFTHDPLRDSLFIYSNRLGPKTAVKNEQNSQIYEF